jgi:hypothetical protein
MDRRIDMIRHPLTGDKPSPLLAWREEELLLVAYAHHFDRGRDNRNPGAFDWRRWAEAAGLSEREALVPLRGLAARGHIEYTDPYGHFIRIRACGVLKAEKSPVAEPVFVARQKELRRRIMASLFWAFHLDGPYGSAFPLTAAPPSPGRTVEELASELREPAGDVLANCELFYDLEFVTGAAHGGKPLRIARRGLCALADTQQRWPLN